MFRFILIKYSNRGLVKNGKISVLFKNLYAVISVTFYVQPFFVILSIIYNCDDFKINVMKTFRVEQSTDIYFSAARYYTTLTFIFLVLLIIMSLAIFFMKKKSSTKLRRQNIYTFKSTLFWGILHFGILILYHSARNQNDFIFCSVLRFVFIFLTHFFRFVILIIDVRKNLPELFSDSYVYYKDTCNILTVPCPRREPLMPFFPFQQNAR